ncbi:MAG TPA: magnesium transporter CorA family protein [Microthrixaceae bacterium]|nr:magnesium transporter CorA family protein [Microthrixaceae bacterium]HNJ68662.1 magnesium transporter CorA family protein [Microthrixaceae bacterium]HNO45151.1 magnesium transporter CorA family protein [Microthrixaceae bacterium]
MSDSVQTRAYRDGKLVEKDFPVEQVSDFLEVDDTTVWVDMCTPTSADLALLADELGLHELAVEDALSRRQRPKLDRYASHLFMACHHMTLDADPVELRESEIDIFIGDRWIITVRKPDGFDMSQVAERCERMPDATVSGVAFVLYALLDVVIDGYFDVIATFDEYYDDVSEKIFGEHPLQHDEQRQWFKVRQALVRFHRLVFPLREAVGSLMRREHDVVGPALQPYYQDLYDHVLRITESTDSLRDLVATIVETNLSVRDYRQNQVMKKVTSWAAIIAVPTLVTGFYGMNVRFAGLGTTWAAWLAVALIVVTSVTLYLMFRRRDWL